MNEVEKFISYFNRFGEQVVECFTVGNCYWFSHILHTRFPQSELMINNVENHFACKIGDDIYDITGKCNDSYEGEWEYWEEYQKVEPIQAERVTDYCILLTEYPNSKVSPGLVNWSQFDDDL